MRKVSEAPYTGDVFWCSDFPGLHDHADKDRYVVVISPPDKLPEQGGSYLVVPASCSTLSTHKVKLPNKTENPQTTSGLPMPCFAVCDEYKLVDQSVLTTWVGDLRTPTVALLQAKVRSVVAARLAEKEKQGTPARIQIADSSRQKSAQSKIP